MNQSNEIQQTLLELHYGLLDEAEAARWRQRIGTEADVARAWADVLNLTGQFAEAAKLQGVQPTSRVMPLPTPAEILKPARLLVRATLRAGDPFGECSRQSRSC